MDSLQGRSKEIDDDSIVVIHSMSDIKLAIKETFCKEVDPELFLRVLKTHKDIFSQQEEENIRNADKHEGAEAILDQLILQENDMKLLIDVLNDEEISLSNIANKIKEITDGLNFVMAEPLENPTVEEIQENVLRDNETDGQTLSMEEPLKNTIGDEIHEDKLLENKTGAIDRKIETRAPSNKQMDLPHQTDNRLDLLLIGKTGNGKSRTGNTILGDNIFKVESSTESVTQGVETWVVNFNGREILVVDQPGVGDTASINDVGKAAELVLDSNKHAFTLNTRGYHAFLLVVRFGTRYTVEDVECVRILKYVFGQDFLKNYGIVIVTCGDNFKTESADNKFTFEEWCHKQVGHFKILLEECNHRAILFDNAAKDETIRCQQVQALIDTVDKLKIDGQRYSFDKFKEHEHSRELFLLKVKEPKIRDEALNKLKLINDEFKQLSQNKSLDDENLKNHLTLIEKVNALSANIKKEDKESNVYADLLGNIDAIHNYIKASVTSIVELKYQQKKIEKETIEREKEKQVFEETLRKIAEHKNTVQQNYELKKTNLKIEYEKKIQLENDDQNKASLEQELQKQLSEFKEANTEEMNGLREKETEAKNDRQKIGNILKDLENKQDVVAKSHKELRKKQKQQHTETINDLKKLKEENKKLLEQIDKAGKEKITLEKNLDQIYSEYTMCKKVKTCVIL